jgi:hypothetical protein
MHSVPAKAPALRYFCRIVAEVTPVVSLGPAAFGERRFVPIVGGAVSGDEFRGKVVSGGVDWQWQRADGVLDIAAHYALQGDDGALVEVRSNGYRHGPPEVLARLARGEAVDPDEYYFRTAITFQTGAPAWQWLNSVMAIGRGIRTPEAAIIDVYLVS